MKFVRCDIRLLHIHLRKARCMLLYNVLIMKISTCGKLLNLLQMYFLFMYICICNSKTYAEPDNGQEGDHFEIEHKIKIILCALSNCVHLKYRKLMYIKKNIIRLQIIYI